MATYSKSTGTSGTLIMVITYSQSIANNRTTFEVEYKVSNTSAPTFFSGIGWDGNTAGTARSGTFAISGAQTVSLGSWTVNKTHADDGTLADQTFTLNINATGTSGVGGPTSFSKTISVPDIPRASTLTHDGPVLVGLSGGTLNLTIDRASSSFTHNLTYEIGSATGTIATGVGTSYAWNLGAVLLEQIPNSTSIAGTITCVTKNGSTTVGTTTRGFTMKAASDVVPTFTAGTHSDTNSTASTEVGAYVQTISTLNLGITGAAGVRGSTITSYAYQVGSFTPAITSASGTMANPLTESGSIDITYTVGDSRGRYYSDTVTVSVLPYTSPDATITAERALSDGTASPEAGTYIRVNITGAVQSLINSTERNELQYTIRTRPNGGSLWTNEGTTLSGDITFSGYELVGSGAFSTTQSYDVEVTVADLFNNIVATRIITTAQVPLAVAQAGIGVGKVWEQGALDVAGDVYVNGLPFVPMPVGAVIPFAGDTAPTNYLIADGSSFDPDAYPYLYAVIGTTYGGSASAPLLPDLRTRVPIGLSSSDTAFDTLGETGGSQTATLSAANMPNTIDLLTTDSAGTATGENSGLSVTQGKTSGRFQHPTQIGADGRVVTPVNIVQPYITLNYIIAAGAVVSSSTFSSSFESSF